MAAQNLPESSAIISLGHVLTAVTNMKKQEKKKQTKTNLISVVDG